MKREIYRRAAVICAVVIALVLLIAIPYAVQDVPRDEAAVSVYVIDVGQGDAVLLRTPEGDVLIDAGTNESQDALLSFLRGVGADTLEYLILTHPHEDHVGGADVLLRELSVAHLLLPEMPIGDGEEATEMARLAAAIGESHARARLVTAGESFMLGEVFFEILSPLPDAEYADANDYSLILRVEYGAVSMLFTGDATGETEGSAEALLLASDRVEKLDCDFLKAGHHGSDTSTTEAFLRAVTPSIVAVSCGAGNVYNHPAQRVLDDIAVIGASCYRTDLEGTLCFRCDGERIWLEK